MNSRPTVYEVAPSAGVVAEAQPPAQLLAAMRGKSNGAEQANGARIVHVEVHHKTDEVRKLVELQRDLQKTVDSFDTLEKALRR